MNCEGQKGLCGIPLQTVHCGQTIPEAGSEHSAIMGDFLGRPNRAMGAQM